MTDFREHHLRTDVCVAAFSSGDRFEFGNLLSRLNLAHVLFRDRPGNWYDYVEGVGNREDVMEYVEQLTLRYPRVYTLGLSRGAHAALLFGQLAHVHGTVAISPVTGAGDAVAPDLGEAWRHRYDQRPGDPVVPDLKPLFAVRNGCRHRVFVSDGDGTELDAPMAQRIGIDDVRVIPGYSHAGLARAMRDAGLFERLFI